MRSGVVNTSTATEAVHQVIEILGRMDPATFELLACAVAQESNRRDCLNGQPSYDVGQIDHWNPLAVIAEGPRVIPPRPHDDDMS